jgi:hypothetical protein
MDNGATTPWEKMTVSPEMLLFLRGTHSLWSRLMNGEHFFAALPNGYDAVNGQTVGYHHISDAMNAEGLRG